MPGFVPMIDLEYEYADIVALGIEVDDDTGEWLVPYAVMFPLGDFDCLRGVAPEPECVLQLETTA